MANKKVSDSALREAIKVNPTGTYTAIAKAVGLATGGYTYRRIDKIRAELTGSKTTEPTLAFSDIKENDRLTRAGKRLVVVTTDQNYIRVRRMDGSTETINRNEFSKHAAEYTKVPVGDPQGGPVTTYFIEPGTEIGGGPGPSQSPQPGSGGNGHKAGMTINPDFEDAIQEMEAMNAKKPISPTTEEVLAEVAVKMEKPIEPKTTDFGHKERPRFDDVDYIDPAWGVVEEATEILSSRRDYLDRIDQLLDIMAPECRKNPLMVVDVKAIAMAMLERGFDEEVRE